MSNPTTGSLGLIGISSAIPCGASIGTAGLSTGSASVAARRGGGGAGGNGRSKGNVIIVNWGMTIVSVAASGTMITTASASVCATMETKTVYFRLPPVLTFG